MANKRNLNKEENRGFTLVELLVVIAIMSILTVITVGQFQQAKMKANDVQRKGDLNSLFKAVSMYYTDLGTLPSAVTMNSYLTDAEGDAEFKDGTGYVYMKVVPIEKITGMPEFCYAVSADGKKFGLFAGLQNKQDGDCNNLNDADKDACDSADNYTCGGSQSYNFVILSPNAGIGDV
ncbi:MAG: type II secretion system protein [Candidatus Shapirobacteria bacterium]|jgi:general secretion pathway protein G